jgi:2-oxoglutarate ferredoxin oxidoreductase subunit alpha
MKFQGDPFSFFFMGGEKRFRKSVGLATEIRSPKQMGDQKADLLLVGWGSTYGVMAQAVEILNGDGISVKGLHLNELWPFPREHVSWVLDGVGKWAVVENNSTGQLARLIQMELQKKPDGNILKYTGRPFMTEEIVESFRDEVLG